MEPWLSRSSTPRSMRAVDRWAIEEQGIPEAELMEAAGTALAEAVAGLAPQGPVRILCGKGNNGGDGLVAARHLGAMRLRGRGAGALRGASSPGRPRRLAGGLRRGRRRDLRHRLRGGAAGAGARRDRSGQPLRRADRRLRHRLRRRRLQRRGRRASRSRPPHRQLPRAPSSGTGSPPASGTPASCVVAPIGIPDGAPVEPAARRRSTPRCSAWRRAGAPRSTKFSSGQVAIAGGSRGLTGAVRMSSLAAIRAGAGYATVAVPADLEPIFEAAQPEVMSVGCPGGDGCLAPASAKARAAGLRARRGGRARARASAATPARSSWRARSCPAIEAPLVLDADGLNAFAGRLEAIAARRRRRRS